MSAGGFLVARLDAWCDDPFPAESALTEPIRESRSIPFELRLPRRLACE
jgi:hypothetical protein